MQSMNNLPIQSDEQIQVKAAATREREAALSRIVMLFIGTRPGLHAAARNISWRLESALHQQ